MTAGSVTTGVGTLTLGGGVTNNAAATAATVSGILNLGGSAARIFNVADGAAAIDLDVSANISNGGLTKLGLGTLALSGVNTYTSPTTNSGDGVLLLNSANALPGGIGTAGGASALTLNGGVLGLGAGDFERGLGAGAAQVTFSLTATNGFAAFGANRIVSIGGIGTPTALTWASTVNFIGANGVLVLGEADADATVDFQNPINLNGAVRSVRADDGTAPVDGILSGVLSGTGGLSKLGSGLWPSV